ncbi:MAG: hypothetical protein IPK98_04210 [Chloracidobacterium sp.]|nr:hypothetical protein [Chloracidobacterium sp.]
MIGIFGIGFYLQSGTRPAAALVAKPPAKQTNQATAANPPASQPANMVPTPRVGDLQSSMSMPRTLVSNALFAPSEGKYSLLSAQRNAGDAAA